MAEIEKELVQVCLKCQKWKDEETGTWFPRWMLIHPPRDFSHGYCPICAEIVKKDYLDNR